MTDAPALPVANRPSGADRVERGIYAQAWYSQSHCYHPSLPPRRLRMAEHFAGYRGTMLTWPSLGGGGISLPYLEEEAYGEVPARYRFYGYVNDRDFIAACRQKSVKPFSVIFCMQGWEFAAELSDDEDEILSLNELRGTGQRAWLGLREFTQDRYPKLWRSFASYFPDGIRNFRGEPVTDLWQEACSRDIHGEPLHSHWLEVPDREQICHYMDLNNPVWLTYLKAVIRIQIDAGVAGIQFDEPSSPISALQYGGCFCDVCMDGFTTHLENLPVVSVPPEVAQELLHPRGKRFHYGSWLLARGLDRIDSSRRDFLTDQYALYTRRTAAQSFLELTTYAREYAESQGREILLSANLYDGLPVFDPHVAMIDVSVPEQRTTLYKQPGWMRYMAGFASGKPMVLNVNPYGGILPELAVQIGRGRFHDRLRVMFYEAAALGVNMSIPYGAWMGSIDEDAFYTPHELAVQVQDFLADREELFGGETLSEVGVVYSMESNFLEVSFRDMTVDDRDTSNHGRQSGRHIPFFRTCDALAAARIPFDAIMFHDGALRADDTTSEQLSKYATVVLPDCTLLSPAQFDAVLGYLDTGGSVVITDGIGCADGRDVTALTGHRNSRRATVEKVVDTVGPAMVALAVDADVAVNLQASAGGDPVLHVVNYDYDADLDRTVTHTDVPVEIRLAAAPVRVWVHTPGRGDQEVPVSTESGVSRFRIPDLGGYAIVEFHC